MTQAENWWDKFGVTVSDPADAESVKDEWLTKYGITVSTDPKTRKWSETAKNAGGVLRGVAPYAAGAGAGFLMAGPPGAAAGAGAVALTDLTTGVASAGSELAGGPHIPGVSETVNRGLDAVGFPAPTSSFGRGLQAVSAGATGGIGLSRAAAQLAPSIVNPTARAVTTAMGQNDTAAILSGAGAGGGQATAHELGMGPFAENLAGLTGGIVAPLAAGQFQAFLPRIPIKLQARTAIRNGFAITPGEATGAQPGTIEVVHNTFSAQSGRAKTEQLFSQTNQQRTNRIAADDIGLPPTEAVTEANINAAKSHWGRVYDQVVSAIPAGVRFRVDNAFVNGIQGIRNRMAPAMREFPELHDNPEVEALQNHILFDTVNGAPVPKTAISPSAAVDTIRELRAQATQNFRATGAGAQASHTLALAQRDAAHIMEDWLERRVSQVGRPDAVRNLREARQRLAKIYDVEAATNIASGNVSARGLYRLLATGRPLSGGLRTIAEAAGSFPRNFQNPESFGSVENWSTLDFFGTGASLAHGSIPMAAGFLSRPLVRQTILSPNYQNQLAEQHLPSANSSMALIGNLNAQATQDSRDGTIDQVVPPESGIEGLQGIRDTGVEVGDRFRGHTDAKQPFMKPSEPFETKLTAAQEIQFQKWREKYAPNDSGYDYDLRGAFKAGVKPGKDGHMPDTWKKPNHPTFSDESKYAKNARAKAGKWTKFPTQVYIPAGQ